MPREQEQDDPDYVVFGAGGPTGLHVLETLIKQGFKVKAVRRSGRVCSHALHDRRPQPTFFATGAASHRRSVVAPPPPAQVVRSPENHGEIVYVAKKLEDEPFGDAEVKLVKGDVTDYASVLEHCKVRALHRGPLF